jgi:hypothetical protein
LTITPSDWHEANYGKAKPGIQYEPRDAGGVLSELRRVLIRTIEKTESKTAQLGGASAETMATDLLREIVYENKAAVSTFQERWRGRILGRIDGRH